MNKSEIIPFNNGFYSTRFIKDYDYPFNMDNQMDDFGYSNQVSVSSISDSSDCPKIPDRTKKVLLAKPEHIHSFCECGCGCPIVKGWNYYLNKPIRFIKGHSNRIPKKNIDEKRMIYLYNQNNTLSVIAKEFKVTPSTIVFKLKKHGITLIKRYSNKIQKKNIDEKRMIDLYNQNNTLRTIAKEFKVTSRTIKFKLKKHGITIKQTKEFLKGRTYPNKLNLNKNQVIEMYNQPLSQSRVAINFQCSRIAIRNVLKRNNIPIRKGSDTQKSLYKRGILKSWNKGFTKENLPILLKVSELGKKRFLNEEWLKKYKKTLNIRPNKPEILLSNLLSSNNLQYKYVGDYNFWINGKNPDFVNINGQKKIIELFGDYWHNTHHRKNKKHSEDYYNPELRKEHFKKSGFDCLIIWESELKNPSQVIQKIREFDNNTNQIN